MEKSLMGIFRMKKIPFSPVTLILFLALFAMLRFDAAKATASIPPSEEFKEDPRHSAAIDLLKKNDYDTVIHLENKIINDDPGDLTAYFVLTLAYLGKDNEKMAIRQAESVKKIDPSFASEIYGTMGRYYTTKKRYHKSLVYLLESLKIKEDPEIMKHVASIYLAQGLLKNAKEYYEKLLDTSPDYISLSRIELAEGNFENAITYARKALMEDKGSSGAYLVLGTAYLLTGRTSLSEANFIILHRLSPEFTLSSYFLGIIKLVEKDYDQALQHFTQLSSSLPRLKEPYLNASVSWHLKGELDKAREAALKAVEADPLDPAAHFALGNIYISRKEYGKADAEYQKAGELFPDLSMPNFRTEDYFRRDNKGVSASLTLALIFSKAGLYLESIKAIHSTIGSRSLDNPVSLMLMAKAQAKLGNLKEAEELYLFLTRVRPELITPLVELGELYDSRGDTAKAAEFLRKASRAAPHSASLNLRLADLYSKAGDLDRSISEYKRAILTSPDSVYGYQRLARVLAQRDEFSEALKYALKGFSVDPEDAEMKDALGWVYFRLGRYDDALKAYSGIAKNGGKNPVFYYHLGLVFQKLENLDGAMEAFEKALDINEEFPEASEAKRMLNKLSGLS